MAHGVCRDRCSNLLLSLGVQRPDDFSQWRNRSYFVWEFGKVPEVCIEIVSNQEGDELTLSRKSQQKGKTTIKKEIYAQIGVRYYAVFDRLRQIQGQDDMNGTLLRVWSIAPHGYAEVTPPEGIRDNPAGGVAEGSRNRFNAMGRTV